jgi:hypothetical protein
MVPRRIDLGEKLAAFEERWSPKIVARLNDSGIKLAKLEGDFVWHSHADTDELFLVITAPEGSGTTDPTASGSSVH